VGRLFISSDIGVRVVIKSCALVPNKVMPNTDVLKQYLTGTMDP